jgi:hypothetical protein
MTEPTHILVVGARESELSLMEAITRRYSGSELHYVMLNAPDMFNYDISVLSDFDRKTWRVISCLDDRGINFSRAKTYFDLRVAGFKFQTFLSASSEIASDAKLGDGVLIKSMTILGAGAKLGVNCHIGARVSIGNDFKAGKHCWISDGVVIGDGVQLSDQTTIGAGSVIESGARIGRMCELSHKKTYSGVIPDLSFFWWEGIGPSRIYDCGK